MSSTFTDWQVSLTVADPVGCFPPTTPASSTHLEVTMAMVDRLRACRNLPNPIPAFLFLGLFFGSGRELSSTRQAEVMGVRSLSYGLSTLNYRSSWRNTWQILCLIVGFPGGSAGKESACNAGDPSLILASGRSPGEGICHQL